MTKMVCRDDHGGQWLDWFPVTRNSLLFVDLKKFGRRVKFVFQVAALSSAKRNAMR
jgi:hypothetical protein